MEKLALKHLCSYQNYVEHEMSKAIKNKVLHYKDMYKKLIAYRLKNRLPEIFDNEVYQHHHIFPRSIFG